MAERMVRCAKLNEELPGLDETTPGGSQALKMALLCGGSELQQQVRERVSARAWDQWKEYMLMVINEYQLDPTSDESNAVLGKAMSEFFFGKTEEVPGYVPPAAS